jgi:hypothetical protein
MGAIGFTVAWAMTTGAAPLSAPPAIEEIDALASVMAVSSVVRLTDGATCVPRFRGASSAQALSVQVIDSYKFFAESMPRWRSAKALGRALFGACYVALLRAGVVTRARATAGGRVAFRSGACKANALAEGFGCGLR